MEITAHNDIASRLQLAWESLRECNLCPRNCGVDRTQGHTGYCGLGWQSFCFREMVFNHEETPLNPSHQVYFTGCNLRCEFCSVIEFNLQPQHTNYLFDADTMAKTVIRKQHAGAKTLNLLGGEPTVNIYNILLLLQRLRADTTVVWNSNMYYSQMTGGLLEGLVDIYLADFKCGNDSCASAMLGAGDYVSVVQENVTRGAARKQTIVRHVLMPGHFDCCTLPILKWLAATLPQVQLSLKSDYVPPAMANAAPIGYSTTEQFSEALNAARSLGLHIIN